MIAITGIGVLGPSDELKGSLDVMIFDATAAALTDAGISSKDYELVCLAASDLFDGRGISTMTLTESTGSMGKWEQRVCNDGLVALDLAVAHIEAGYARSAVVASWNKGSDIVDSGPIASAAVEPLLRDLAIAPEVFAALSSGTTIVREHHVAWAMRDVAVALFITRSADPSALRVHAHRRVTDTYLYQRRKLSQRLQALLDAACADASLTGADITMTLLTGALAYPSNVELAVPTSGVDTSRGCGYAAGLVGIAALRDHPAGRYAICGADSIGQQELAVTIVEKTT